MQHVHTGPGNVVRSRPSSVSLSLIFLSIAFYPIDLIFFFFPSLPFFALCLLPFLVILSTPIHSFPGRRCRRNVVPGSTCRAILIDPLVFRLFYGLEAA